MKTDEFNLWNILLAKYYTTDFVINMVSKNGYSNLSLVYNIYKSNIYKSLIVKCVKKLNFMFK